MSWELLWKISLIGVLVAFAVLSVLVTILGAIDIKTLLKRLGEDRPEE
jgi:hypothetical protein